MRTYSLNVSNIDSWHTKEKCKELSRLPDVLVIQVNNGQVSSAGVFLPSSEGDSVTEADV